jgi:hypothetical protein
MLAEKEEGIVVVPVDPPPLDIAIRGLVPTLATVAAALLLAGTAIGALLVFRPTHGAIAVAGRGWFG